MKTQLPEPLDPLDVRVTGWMARHGVRLTRLALGLVFAWFGVLKFFPGASPAADLATRTIERLSSGLVSAATGLTILAVWETAIGLGLLTGRLLRITLLLLFLQMAGTLLPLVYFPEETFEAFPYAPTLEGQYIVKNVVLIAAAIVVGATVRGGGLRSGGRPGGL
ncbi:MAG TPA: hypothetical protein VFD43_02455 [Planctomycetota bacterium]|nr:hypothetical protein [Planctomycetota bacterium]